MRAEYESLAFRGNEMVEDFALRLTTIVNQLATLGDPEPADKVVEKYLRAARPRFNQLVLSIETLLDISTLSLEEVTGRLKAAEDSGQISSPANNGGTLYLTEAEWYERHKKKEQETKGGGGSGNSLNRVKRRGGKGRNGGGGAVSSESAHSGPARKDDKCRNYSKLGHWAKDCRSKPRRDDQVHAAQDDEPTLMLLSRGLLTSSTATRRFQNTARRQHRQTPSALRWRSSRRRCSRPSTTLWTAT